MDMYDAVASAVILYTNIGSAVVFWYYAQWAWLSRKYPHSLWYAIVGIAILCASYFIYSTLILSIALERHFPDVFLLSWFDQRMGIWVWRIGMIISVWLLVFGLVGETKLPTDVSRWRKRLRNWFIGAILLFPFTVWIFTL